ncbi:MAG TPA: tRNA (adenosine(37)-N6)-threonylcarbamoyltransferase complex transferase subunit TsaD [Vitreimonas sp.]|uniref:tRNA (adenosine(37)-N6)-threonylcarbamoyltransferase complex transferase subunit TsaD n=1 Tax=Vitreimonas sp. TaxID=3069702 RepID=UPI002D6A8B26|nr:tRNA (adenosine(37)-N6)-threonylcarbamoyltransferase complex transferase subunit TsaD [Vitreimonas sp.]HYD89769.1 tRNA (adenosine(37)-N6)-threonylcarbamoyltransferase complex transferase subunit TsaD [Vitreimonas sp.]
MKPLTVLGIETSCDETAAAVLRLEESGPVVLSDIVLGQAAQHAPYKGVVPEIAARAHVEGLDGVIAAAIGDAGLGFADLDGVAATAGPGLIGGVMVGLLAGKAIALAHGKPLLAVNHLEGHALSPRLAEGGAAFPYLLLLVSGGHCQFIAVLGVGHYRRLGSTMDDALGEAFDKLAKLLDLGFPGGPLVEKAAQNGDSKRFSLPRPLLGRAGCDFSFAGLKTACAREAERLGALTDQDKADLCASFQAAVCDIVEDRTRRAMAMFEDLEGAKGRLVVAGGVGANQAIRSLLQALGEERGYAFVAPPLRWCTDNGAMIALAGAERLRLGFSDDLSFPARPRWPLDGEAARLRPSHKPGRKGAKA